MADNPPLPQPDGQEPNAEKLKTQYTAVIYIHGMGDQRRNEEVSSLIDCLDRYSYYANDIEKVGILRNIEADLEADLNDSFRNVTCVRVSHIKREGKKQQSQVVKFYEAYWAPIMSGNTSLFEVTMWILAQVKAPLKGLFSPWRLRSRLRIATLHSHWETLKKRSLFYTDQHLTLILKLYNEFEGPAARRGFRRGTSEDFKRYIQSVNKIGRIAIPDEIKLVLIEILHKWKSYYIQSEILNLFVIITLLLALALGYGSVLFLAALILQWFNATHPTNMKDYIIENWKSIGTISGLLLGTLGISGFLKNYLGDVQKWATYTETDQKYEQRSKVIDIGASVFRHVLSDSQCNRIVVVAHSLGTSVAHDTLLEIGRYNRARNEGGAPIKSPLPLYKIEHFISLATPIDKIHYFFENYKSKIHRYNRVVEKIRGDISEVPFAKNHQRQVHWINFWDAADIISGSVESPSNAEYFRLRVDNHQVFNRIFPDPAKSHHAYFDDKFVLEVLFETIFNRKYSFIAAPRKADGIPDFDAQLVGQGGGILINRFFQILMLILPWTIAVYIAASYFSAIQIKSVVGWTSIFILLILFIGYGISWLRGHLNSY